MINNKINKAVVQQVRNRLVEEDRFYIDDMNFIKSGLKRQVEELKWYKMWKRPALIENIKALDHLLKTERIKKSSKNPTSDPG